MLYCADGKIVVQDAKDLKSLLYYVLPGAAATSVTNLGASQFRFFENINDEDCFFVQIGFDIYTWKPAASFGQSEEISFTLAANYQTASPSTQATPATNLLDFQLFDYHGFLAMKLNSGQLELIPFVYDAATTAITAKQSTVLSDWVEKAYNAGLQMFKNYRVTMHGSARVNYMNKQDEVSIYKLSVDSIRYPSKVVFEADMDHINWEDVQR